MRKRIKSMSHKLYIASRKGLLQMIGLSLILGRYVIGRVHGRLPLFFPLRGRFLAVPDGSVTSFVHHAMLLLVKRVQGAKGDAQIAVLDLPISLGFHLVLDFLLAFEVSVGHPMHHALLFPRSHHVQDELVHHAISLVLFIGFVDAQPIVGLAFIDGGYPFVAAMVIRVFRAAKLGQ